MNTVSGFLGKTIHSLTSEDRPSPLRDRRPQRVGARRHHPSPEIERPMAFVAEPVAPRPQPPGQAVQAVRVCEADGGLDRREWYATSAPIGFPGTVY
jgi:hypothetical protein